MVSVAIVFAALFVILLLATLLLKGKEYFTPGFKEMQYSSESLDYKNMGDHNTLVMTQKGNSGKTVLLLHNSPMNLNVWLPLYHTMQRMAMDGFKTPNLICYDLRGHGTAWMPVDNKYNDSNEFNRAWKIKDFVEDCRKIHEDVIGDTDITLCGFGFGGLVAQKYALEYPENIAKLVILQTTIRPMEGIRTEVEYLSSWAMQNKAVDYLTTDKEYIDRALCDWFYIPGKKCQYKEGKYTNDDTLTPQFNLVTTQWREASTTTTLQADKMLLATDLIDDWKNAKNIKFSVHIVAGTEDSLAPPNQMTKTYTTIYNNNRELMVILDIVNGLHGFAVMRPDYIAGIICADCDRLSAQSTFQAHHPEKHGY